jgi:tetratricopeptide (TPR) repeat protein
LNITLLRPTGRRTTAVAFARSALLLLAVTLGGGVSAQTTEDISTWLRDGSFYFAQGDCALAQYFFQEALKRDPSSVEAMVGRGRAMSCQGAFPAAVESFREALNADANYVPAYVQLALTYQQQHSSDPRTYASRLGDAIDVLLRAERLAPRDPTVFNTKGIIYYEAGDLQQAQDALSQANTLAAEAGLSDRERSVILVNLGRTYRDLAQLELAQNAFRRAVILDPTSASAHNNLGNINYRLGDCAGAEYELAQAASLAPTSLSAVSQLAVVLFECGDVAGAIPYLERSLTLEGAVFAPPLYTYLSRAYVEAGRFEDAVRRAQQGALLPPETAAAHFYLGRAYLARNAGGDVAAARAAFQRALELNPNYQEALAALDALR